MNGKKPVKTIKPLVLRFSRFLVRLFLKVFFGCSYHYEQPLSLEGPVIFASNHQSYLDPPTVGAGIAKGIYFMAKQELFSNWFFGALISFYNAVPVRRGVMDWRAVARIKETLKAGGSVLVFPEGTRSRDGQLGKARFGAGLLAQETGAVIVPVYVRGTDCLLAAFMRKRPMAVFYGCPLPPEQYGSFERSTRGQLAVSELIMQKISCMQQAYDTVDFTRGYSGPEKS